jgi:hypothetical protein
MAASVLFLGGKLGRRHFETGRLKDGVVTEPARPSRRREHATLPRTLGDERGGIVGAARERDHALIARRAALRRHIAKLFEHLLQVGEIGRAFAGVAGRIDAGAATQRIDLDSGVVGERGEAGQARGMARFQQRVFSEGQSGFRRRIDSERGLRDELVAERCKDRGKLT